MSLYPVVGYAFIIWGMIELAHWLYGSGEVINALSRLSLSLFLKAIWRDLMAIGFLIAGFGLVLRKPFARRFAMILLTLHVCGVIVGGVRAATSGDSSLGTLWVALPFLTIPTAMLLILYRVKG